MAAQPAKRGEWWLNLKLGKANDRKAVVALPHQGVQTLEDGDFEYRVEIISKDGKKFTSESGGFWKRRKELEEG